MAALARASPAPARALRIRPRRGPNPARLATAPGRPAHVRRHGMARVPPLRAQPMVEISYGQLPDQIGDLTLPDGEKEGGWPVVALLHGGFWLEPYYRDTMDKVAEDLANAGYAVWNLEYRRTGRSGGGWPETFEDAVAGLDHVLELGGRGVDTRRVVVVGHSAGGHLAAWAALRPCTPGNEPRLKPRAVVAVAGVFDLEGALAAGVGRNGITRLLGEPLGNDIFGFKSILNDVMPRKVDQSLFAKASPQELLGELGRAGPAAADVPPFVLVHGENDKVVPPSQSLGFAAAAEARGMAVSVEIVPGERHMDVLSPESATWGAVRGAVARGMEAGE